MDDRPNRRKKAAFSNSDVVWSNLHGKQAFVCYNSSFQWQPVTSQRVYFVLRSHLVVAVREKVRKISQV